MENTQNALFKNLKLTQISEKERIDLNCFPGFMLIGPQRTGTTWLSLNLERHPEILFSSPKEIHYFNLLSATDHPLYKSSELSWYLSFFKESPQKYIRRNLKTFKRYKKLFRLKIRGEGTASYAAMDVNIIKEIALLRPDLKIIIMIRHPIDRAWSHAKKDLMKERKRSLTEISDQDFYDFFSSFYQLSCGNYQAIIENWSSFLSKENIFIGLFEDISRSPNKFLLDVFKFLNIESGEVFISGLSKKELNSTEGLEIPSKYRHFLCELLSQEISFFESCLKSMRENGHYTY
jgi:hypothetical protein